MRKIEDLQYIYDKFCPPEGEIHMVAGEPGAGKTYLATKWILDDLRKGIPVYANWKINFEGIDERRSKTQLFFSIIMPWRKEFFVFDKKNFHYLDPLTVSAAELKKIVDAKLYIDEGQFLLSSYKGTSIDQDSVELVVLTRHCFRTLTILSQRFNAVHIHARNNVHRYFKCDKVLSWPLIVFRVTEYRKLRAGEVDEEESAGTKLSIGSKEVYTAYDSHYMRTLDAKADQHVTGYVLTYWERIRLFLDALRPSSQKRRA